MLVGHLCIFLSEMPLQVFVHFKTSLFVFLVVTWRNWSHSWMAILCWMHALQMFRIGGLLILLIVSFDTQKFLLLIKPNLSVLLLSLLLLVPNLENLWGITAK